jgi:uncharacterized protein DUF4031
LPDHQQPGAAEFGRLSSRFGGPSSMSVYIDQAIWDWHGLKWAHLLADDTDELHRFAARLGIHRTSYQGPPKTSIPHYDLTGYERRRAIASGAIACSREEIVAVVRRLRPRPAIEGRELPATSRRPAPAATGHDPLRASDVSSTASAQNSLQA